MSSLHGWAAAVAVAATVAATGCAARASTAVPIGFAELRYGGAYSYYPHAVYQGRDVFFVEGRWIFRTKRGWAYYPVEPEPLYRFRTTVRQAPPAPRYEFPRYEQVPRVPAEPAPAPPATRVR